MPKHLLSLCICRARSSTLNHTINIKTDDIIESRYSFLLLERLKPFQSFAGQLHFIHESIQYNFKNSQVDHSINPYLGLLFLLGYEAQSGGLVDLLRVVDALVLAVVFRSCGSRKALE